MKSSEAFHTSNRLTLEPVKESDAEHLFSIFSDDALSSFLINDNIPISSEEVLSQWKEEGYLNSDEEYLKKDLLYVIKLTTTSDLMGFVYLSWINKTHERAELEITLRNSKVLGKGYGSEAIKLLTEYAFNRLCLTRLYLYVLDYNHRAIKCYEKCGFVKEAELRKHHKYKNEYHSVIMMGLNKEDWLDSDLGVSEPKVEIIGSKDQLSVWSQRLSEMGIGYKDTNESIITQKLDVYSVIALRDVLPNLSGFTGVKVAFTNKTL